MRASFSSPSKKKGDGARERPRLLFIQTQAENAGAQEISCRLGEGLEPCGYDIHHLFFYRSTDAFDHLEKAHFCVTKRPRSPFEFAYFLFRLVKLIAQIRPDVALTFQHYGNVFGAPAARLVGVPHVIANQVSALETMNRMVRLVDKVIGSLGFYDQITVNSRCTSCMYETHPPAYRKRVTYVPHGFKDKGSVLSKAQARARFGLPERVTLLGSVSRLHPLKRIDVAIRTLVHDTSWHLALGGQGPAEDELRALANDLGVVSRVHFIGELCSDEVGDLLATMDLFLFPSEAETFGLAAVEAAATGLPVVSNGIEVMREVLSTNLGPCAYFADSDHPDSYIAPIRRLLDHPEEAQALARSGMLLKQLYPPDAMIQRYDAMITDLCAPRPVLKEAETV